MDAQQDPRIPDLKFRVLIIGRANAGKTTILQKVCDTAEKPRIFTWRTRDRDNRVKLNPTIERGMHNIEDELVFTKHEGYVFHDSRGFECGSQDEVKIVQDFVRRKSQEKRLTDRLHAIWYCIPMDNDRPELDLKHFDEICPDKNVPVIAVFTKYDQFKRDIKMKLEDENRETDLDGEVEKIFNQHYLANLGGHPPFVCLERMHKPDQHCTDLIELTANALSGKIVALILMAVQKDDLEVSIKYAMKWDVYQTTGGTKAVTRTEMRAFKKVWAEFANQKTGFLERARLAPFFRNLGGIFEVRIYPTEHSLRNILASCWDTTDPDFMRRYPISYGVNVRLLNKTLSTIDYEEIRRRRRLYCRIYHEATIIHQQNGRISFTDMLLLLAHHKFIVDKDALVLQDLVIRTATNKLVSDLVDLDRVRSLVKGISERRRFLAFMRKAREAAPEHDLPEMIVVEDNPSTPPLPPVSSRGITSTRRHSDGVSWAEPETSTQRDQLYLSDLAPIGGSGSGAGPEG